MASARISLQEKHPKHYFVPLLLTLSTVGLGFGLFLPVITMNELVFWKHTFSILTGIESLFLEKHYFLAAIILLFSIIFPFLKLLVLFSVWFFRLSDEQRASYIHLLNAAGKWSMLDVFVVALTIVIAKISGFASATPEVGIYFFAFSIMLAMIVTFIIEGVLGKKRAK